MPRWARAVLAFLALPGIVAFTVPVLMLWPDVATRAPRSIGLIPFIAGVALLGWCVRDFYVAGKGTLAPWDPPRNLVIVGLYRYSRNPMYVAVSLILIGWTIGYRSGALAIYTLAVMIMFHLRVVFGEEPWLARTHHDEWRRYAAQVPRWLFPRDRRLLFVLPIVIGTAAAAGSIAESIVQSSAVRRFPAPGVFIDTGGRRLHLICIGEGEPTVLFEASGFGVSSLSAATVRERLSAETKVCSYDRMGMGWSDAGPHTVSAGVLANDLLTLQDRAGLRGPFIIVASSVGGLTAEIFARRHPERVVGLMFLDAASSDGVRHAASRFSAGAIGSCAAAMAARLGLIRLIDPFDLVRGDSEQARRSAAFTYSAKSIGTLCAIVRGLPATLREFDDAKPMPGDVRLVVLSAEKEDVLPFPVPFVGSIRAARLDVHQALAKQSTRGSWRMIPGSDHLIASSQPGVVSDAVLAMLADIRRSGR